MRTRTSFVATMLLATMTMVFAPSGRAWAASWQLVTPPVANGLGGVSAVASDDVWVVGQSPSNQPLAANWDGTSWSVIPTPPLDLSGWLGAVATLPTGRAWAVGAQFSNEERKTLTLIESWNGTRWRVVPTPNVYVGQQDDLNELTDVSVVSAHDVWAVGIARRTGAPDRNIIEHWDGTTWSLSSVPSPGGQINGLFGVSMSSAGHGLAVGQEAPPFRTVAARLGHGSWRIRAFPDSGDQALYGVLTVSNREAWAVGGQYLSSYVPLVEHFVRGEGWTSIPPGTHTDGEFDAVAASSFGDMWAVGTDYSHQNGTLISHWDGTRWSRIAGPSTRNVGLNDVTVVPGSEEAWAVGGNAFGPILLHYA